MPASRVLEDFDIFSADKPSVSKSELSNRLFGDVDSDDDDDDMISSKLFVRQATAFEKVFCRRIFISTILRYKIGEN